MTKEPHQAEIMPDIGAYNDSISDIYDAATKAEGWSINKLVEQTLEAHHSTKLNQVLDLGAGTGQTVEAIRRATSFARLVVVDASPKMLNHLSRKYPSTDIEPVCTTNEDICRAPARHAGGGTSRRSSTRPDELGQLFDSAMKHLSERMNGELPMTLGWKGWNRN